MAITSHQNITGTTDALQGPSVADTWQLQKLRVLNLPLCSVLNSFPSELWGLQALEVLNLRMCPGLTSLPAELSKLQSLTPLDLGGCKHPTAHTVPVHSPLHAALGTHGQPCTACVLQASTS